MGPKSLKKQSFVIFGAKISAKKSALKMLMKLTPDVNFINVLQASLTSVDRERAKKTIKLSFFFALLGSASAQKLRVKCF